MATPGVVLPPEKKGGGFKGFLKSAFPFITAAAGVAGGPGAAALLSKLGGALGVNNPNPTMDDLEVAYLNATPEQILAAKSHEEDVALKMKQAGFEHAEALQAGDNADRASARMREVSVRDRTPALLALAVTFGFFGMLYVVAVVGVKPGSETLTNVMLGALSTAWLAVVMYYFGSSSGSAAKTELLARSAPALPEAKPLALTQ